MSDDQIRKYERWIDELETRKTELARSSPGLRRFFLGVLVASAGGFLVGARVGAGAVITGLLVWMFGIYSVRIRRDDYVRELRHARNEVARLRALQGDPPA